MRNAQTLLPEVEAEQWAVELANFAEARQGKIGISTSQLVRAARELADNIRDVGREIRDARNGEDHATTGILLENLGELRKQALEILSGRLPKPGTPAK